MLERCIILPMALPTAVATAFPHQTHQILTAFLFRKRRLRVEGMREKKKRGEMRSLQKKGRESEALS